MSQPAVAQVTAVARVQSLVGELPHATGGGKKKKSPEEWVEIRGSGNLKGLLVPAKDIN